MLSRIHSATIEVADQDAALDFYVNTLGWEVGLDNPMGPEMRYLSVAPPGAATQLVLGHSSLVQRRAPCSGHVRHHTRHARHRRHLRNPDRARRDVR